MIQSPTIKSMTKGTRTDATLTEWVRLLAPSGTMRLDVPSLLHLAGWALSPEYRDADRAAFVIHMMFGTQAYPGDYHLTSFTPATLEAHLARAGLFVRSVELRDGWLFAVAASREPAPIAPVWPVVPLMEHFEALNRAHQATLASTSWRLTAPLRALVSAARTLLTGTSRLLPGGEKRD